MKITTVKRIEELKKHPYVMVRFAPEETTTETVRLADGSTEFVLGLKEALPMNSRKLRTLVRRIVSLAKQGKKRRIALDIASLTELPGAAQNRSELLRTIAENVTMADYEFVTFKTAPKGGWHYLEEIALIGDFTQEDKAALRFGEILAEEVNKCRELSNTPGGDMTPSVLAARIVSAAKGTGATTKILGKKALEKLGMGAILGVAKGSKEEPKLIIVEYRGGNKNDAPIVLVGKGVTFDTGGLNLKPTNFILDMHMDMSGGAAVAHAVIAAARLKLRTNVIALVPAAENMPSGESYRPGDVLHSMSGKTIEILDTDAEGRVLLSDALTYAQRYKPSLVVDVATLTGAAVVALGTKASAVLSKDDTLAQKICALGEESGDYCWPFPMWDEYKDAVKGRFGDISNIPTENARQGGTINGAMFLAEFADGYPWVHIDIAPRMTSDKSDVLAPGAAGAPVRLLVRLLEQNAH